MAAIAWSDVTAAASNDPLIVGFAAGGQTIWLNVANTALDVSMFDGEDGSMTKAARCMFCAHFAALGRLGMAGPLTAESDGRMSRQYAIPNTRSEYMTTSYGRAYWQLIGAQAHGPRLL